VVFLLAAVGMASIAAAATPARPSQASGKSQGADVARRVEASRPTNEKPGSVSQFLAAPSCAISDQMGDDHLASIHNRNRTRGIIGGSYGEIFFASGAGTRASSAGSAMEASDGGVSVSSPGTGGGSSGSTPSAPGNGNGNGGGTGAPGNGNGQGAENGGGQGSANAGAAPGQGGNNGGGSSGPAAGPGGALPPMGAAPPSAVNPEPATLLLLGTGFATVLVARSRQRRRNNK